MTTNITALLPFKNLQRVNMLLTEMPFVNLAILLKYTTTTTQNLMMRFFLDTLYVV